MTKTASNLRLLAALSACLLAGSCSTTTGSDDLPRETFIEPKDIVLNGDPVPPLPEILLDSTAFDPGIESPSLDGADPSVEEYGTEDPGPPADPGNTVDPGQEDLWQPPVDSDGDGIPDTVDNCPQDKNPGQENLDGDGYGDACDEDTDGDGIPDTVDLWPSNPALPGTAQSNTVYAHSSKVLYAMDVQNLQLTEIGNFGWPADGGGHQMTDIALDQFGVLYGVTFDRLYTCVPQSAACTNLGELPESFNGLTLVPAGTVLPDSDALIGISNDGGWYHLDFTTSPVQASQLGAYGYPYDSSGDAFSIDGIGTFATVDKVGESWDVLVKVDTLTGEVETEITTLTGHTSVYGLAGWGNEAFIFDSSGDILVVNIATGNSKVLSDTSIAWWGAGVTTRM